MRCLPSQSFHLHFLRLSAHFPIGSVEGLKWLVGGRLTAFNTFSIARLGFDWDISTGGVDYKFANIPLNVSADFRPTFAIVIQTITGIVFSTYSRFYAGNVGASALHFQIIT